MKNLSLALTSGTLMLLSACGPKPQINTDETPEPIVERVEDQFEYQIVKENPYELVKVTPISNLALDNNTLVTEEPFNLYTVEELISRPESSLVAIRTTENGVNQTIICGLYSATKNGQTRLFIGAISLVDNVEIQERFDIDDFSTVPAYFNGDALAEVPSGFSGPLSLTIETPSGGQISITYDEITTSLRVNSYSTDVKIMSDDEQKGYFDMLADFIRKSLGIDTSEAREIDGLPYLISVSDFKTPDNINYLARAA